MISEKEILFEVSNEENYVPLSEWEKIKIADKIYKEVCELVEKFDGGAIVKIIVRIVGKGNA